MITPGPWKESEGYIYSEEGDHYTIIADVGVDHDPEGAIFAGNQTLPTDERNANIDLIKAAPDLLKACHAMLECTGSSDNWKGETEKALKAIEEAIAKAERRT